jgi:hypothetical protein
MYYLRVKRTSGTDGQRILIELLVAGGANGGIDVPACPIEGEAYYC